MLTGASRSHETEVVVVGSGLGGLCCAAMLATYGVQASEALPRNEKSESQCMRSLGPSILDGHTDGVHCCWALVIRCCICSWGVASSGNALSVVQVTVCESHSIPGGAAHAWVDRGGYHFESGPSLYSGMSGR